MSEVFEQVMAQCARGSFTGLLRVMSREGNGEVRFISGIQDGARFEALSGDAALERLQTVSDHEFEAIASLPPIDPSATSPVPIEGGLDKLHAAQLMRYCESNSLTCALEIETGGKLLTARYRLGELLSVEPDWELTSQLAEAKQGVYRFKLPRFDLPPGVRSRSASSAAIPAAAASVARPAVSAAAAAGLKPAAAPAVSPVRIAPHSRPTPAATPAAVRGGPSSARTPAAPAAAPAARAPAPAAVAPAAARPMAAAPAAAARPTAAVSPTAPAGAAPVRSTVDTARSGPVGATAAAEPLRPAPIVSANGSPAPATPRSGPQPTAANPTAAAARAPASPVPASPTPASPVPASPVAASPVAASPVPASPAPASPAPAKPVVASPAPAAEKAAAKAASPAPAAPAPAAAKATPARAAEAKPAAGAARPRPHTEGHVEQSSSRYGLLIVLALIAVGVVIWVALGSPMPGK